MLRVCVLFCAWILDPRVQNPGLQAGPGTKKSLISCWLAQTVTLKDIASTSTALHVVVCSYAHTHYTEKKEREIETESFLT